jgi:hypothetical protein
MSTKKHYAKAGTCESCRHWRDKGWDGDSGIGICDNPKVEVRVTMGEYFLTKFCKVNSQDAMAVERSIRFPSEFGCIFHEVAPWMRKEVALGIRVAATKERVGNPTGAKRSNAKPSASRATPKNKLKTKYDEHPDRRH